MIDWEQPIYSNGQLMAPSPDEPHDTFRSLVFDGDPNIARWYYHEDGSPFGTNSHPITNESNQLDMLPAMNRAAMEELEGYGTW